MCMGEKDIQFFVDKRKIRDGELDHMTGSDQELRHAKEVFELMKALTHDNQFEKSYNANVLAGKENVRMCDVLTDVKAQGRKQGIQEHAILMYKKCRASGMSKEEAIQFSEVDPKLVADLK